MAANASDTLSPAPSIYPIRCSHGFQVNGNDRGIGGLEIINPGNMIIGNGPALKQGIRDPVPGSRNPGCTVHILYS